MRTDGRVRAGAAAAVVALLVVVVGAMVGLGPATAQSRCEPGQARWPTVPWQQERLGYGPDSALWATGRGAGVSVVVLDTVIATPGSDGAHPQLADMVVAEAALPAPPPPDGCYWHGTFVTGLIAADPLDGVGVAGIAPDANLTAIRVTDETGSVEDVAALARGIDRAVAAGANVINVSLITARENPQLERAVRRAVDAGVVVVAAAGNSEPVGQTWPATIDGVIAVGATGPDDQPADFTQVLPDAVAVAAPGVDVVSTYPRDRYQAQSGSSFAAALVAGTVALVRAAHPDLTPAQVRHRLEVTADQPPGDLPDPRVGWGVVNPLEAVTAVLPEEAGSVPAPIVPVVDPPGQPAAPDTTLQDRALVLAGVAMVVVVGTLALTAAVRGSRRRSVA